jgi:hypothetical protein
VGKRFTWKPGSQHSLREYMSECLHCHGAYKLVSFFMLGGVADLAQVDECKSPSS